MVIGTGLLHHALIRCVQGARLIGGCVNAIDVDAAAFWQRRGFRPYPHFETGGGDGPPVSSRVRGGTFHIFIIYDEMPLTS